MLDALITNARIPASGEVSNGNRHLDHAIQFIERHHHHHFPFSAVADYCNIDRSYLSHLFQRQFGYGPKKYLLLLRIKAATSLLMEQLAD